MRASFCFLLLALLPACSAYDLESTYGSEIQFDGAVTYLALEGGAWVVQGDDGTTYEAGPIPAAYLEEGLRVRVSGDLVEDAASILMVGPIVRIERIERL